MVVDIFYLVERLMFLSQCINRVQNHLKHYLKQIYFTYKWESYLYYLSGSESTRDQYHRSERGIYLPEIPKLELHNQVHFNLGLVWFGLVYGISNPVCNPIRNLALSLSLSLSLSVCLSVCLSLSHTHTHTHTHIYIYIYNIYDLLVNIL